MYLGYVLIFILEDICIVCISIYILNIVNTILIYKKLKRIPNKKTAKVENIPETSEEKENLKTDWKTSQLNKW